MIHIIREAFFNSLNVFTLSDVLDILLVSVVLYQALLLAKNTRAFQILKGVALLLVVTGLTNLMGLSTISWVFNQVLYVSSIAAIVIFQPELRRALEHIGRGRFKNKNKSNHEGKYASSLAPQEAKIVQNITEALVNLSQRKVGALLVLERKTGLQEHIGTGTLLDADISAPLLEQIFEPNTPLHDGATIIHGGKIVSAGCFLPLSDNVSISRELGTRHRAALGISEVSDSLTFVVSEETGIISCAQEGKLERPIDKTRLEMILADEYADEASYGGVFRQWWNGKRSQ